MKRKNQSKVAQLLISLYKKNPTIIERQVYHYKMDTNHQLDCTRKVVLYGILESKNNKVQNKKMVLKVARVKQQVTSNTKVLRITADISVQIMKARILQTIVFLALNDHGC